MKNTFKFGKILTEQSPSFIRRVRENQKHLISVGHIISFAGMSTAGTYVYSYSASSSTNTGWFSL